MWKSILAVALGAALGAVLRWQLGERFNGLSASLPPGTWLANGLGAYVAGLALAFLAQAPGLSDTWRLLLITGFCGGLTTFSGFALELLHLLQAGRPGGAALMVVAHLGGSLLLLVAGMATWQWLRSG